MRALSAIVAFALLAQSLGLAAPCMCDVDAAAETAAAVAAPAAARSTAHACCAGHGGDEAAATSSQAERRAGAASLAQRCAEGCGCDATLSPATLAARQGWATCADDAQDVVVHTVTPATPTLLIRGDVARWVGPPDPDVGPDTTARRLARLQRWRC